MTKATVTQAAAPVHVDQKTKFESVVDSKGRTIQLRKLDPLQQARLVMAVGAEVAQNGVYMNGFAMPAASVVYIDDTPFGLPGTLKQIESMLSELGEEGMAAISSHLMAKYEAAKEESERAAASAEQEAAKN